MIAVTYSSILGMDGNHPVASMLPYGNANDYVINTIKRVAPPNCSYFAEIPIPAVVTKTNLRAEISFLKSSIISSFVPLSQINNPLSIQPCFFLSICSIS